MEEPGAIDGGAMGFLVLRFSPQQAGQFFGTLRVESNAENEPTRDFPLRGCGRGDAGMLTCAQ